MVVDSRGGIQNHQQKEKGMPKAEIVIHVLFQGRPACDFTKEVPGSWPKDHYWVSLKDARKATCPQCKGSLKQYAAEAEEK